MTCKDCINEKFCCDLDIEPCDHSPLGDRSTTCIYFKPKSRFVELPCEIGQMVYRVSFAHKNVIPLKVEGFLRNLTSWKVHCTHLIPSWVGNQKEHIYISFSSFGKTVFLDPAKAENALKERKSE